MAWTKVLLLGACVVLVAMATSKKRQSAPNLLDMQQQLANLLTTLTQNSCVYSPWEDVPLPTDPIDKQIELVSDRIDELEEALEDCFDDADDDL